MAETVKGSVVLKSVPNKDVEKKVAFYLATIKRDMSPAVIVEFLTRSKPLAIVEDVTREKGQELAKAINGFGASAYFLQYLKNSSRH